ncbi:Serine protease, subtilisin family [Chitinophaga rupis]|uniref:Serine protease, subtilisin family n=1 Tax=Chitinophaga rupis TaxID=573321 RepID=A0A1H8IYJ7_9BACT|nr:S8/S53 family peptidase [Chitinophaga rupis]SEN73683.1 Serine protease, subtilisin family [Chitinophaga rupis]
MKTKTLIVLAFLGLATACSRTEQITAPQPAADTLQPVISKTAINNFVQQQLKANDRFEWRMASDEMVWSALVQGDSILSVGYQPAGFQDINKKIHTININSSEWKAAREQVLQLIIAQEQKSGLKVNAQSITAFEEKVLPVIDVKVSRLSTIKALRKSLLVRYAEPTGYGAVMNTGNSNGKTASDISSSGCGDNTANTALAAGQDYTVITPAAKQSWNYPYHNINAVWNAGITGAGVKVMIIDTGVSPDQENLGSDINQGLSAGRTVEKLVTSPGGSIDDGCGHGTKMAGVLGAPRGTDGNTAGVAYNANLVLVHAAQDVFLLGSSEIKGVADAYVLAGNRSDVKIVSMSMGTIFSSSQISDAIRYANNNGKLLFCAAGTSFDWTAGWAGVIFPGNMSEVMAVTGIKDNLTERCGTCHTGSAVDFTVVMEKVSTGRTVLSLAMDGDGPSTVGGSSAATASCAGIAALVWSKFPAYTKDQVIDKMAHAANYYPNRNGSFGWGRVNALAAIQ